MRISTVPVGLPKPPTQARPVPKATDPLLPFEQRTLDYVINQVKALSPRAQAAFFSEIADKPAFVLKYLR